MLRCRISRYDALTYHPFKQRVNGSLQFSTSLYSRSPGSRSIELRYDPQAESTERLKSAMTAALLFPTDSDQTAREPSTDEIAIEKASSTKDAIGSSLAEDTGNSPLQESKHLQGISKPSSNETKIKATNQVKRQLKLNGLDRMPKKVPQKVQSGRRTRRTKSVVGLEMLQKNLTTLAETALGFARQAQDALGLTSNRVKGNDAPGSKNEQGKRAVVASVAGKRISRRARSTKSKAVAVESEIPTSAESIKSKTLVAKQMSMEGLKIDHPAVKKLCHGLDCVLFKQGAYNLQDPRTGVYNFDQYLQDIMPAEEFDFDSLGAFITSSKDSTLQDLAKKNGKSYVGSTSSMTSVLAHFHFLLSNFRPLNFARVSSGFPNPLKSFTEFTRIPSALYLRYKDGVYSLDADKTFDRGTILSQLGQSMEKLLLLPPEQYEQYRRSSPEKVPEEVKNTPEAYHYSTIGNFVFRSQLDGHHDWLPGTGIFDVKTRACVTIRMNQQNYKQMSGYQIKDLYGEWESYEREYVDMLRSTMLKYSLQVRMGRMDGIFVAFHNTEQIFGFQYIPLSEMDLAIHGQENLALGDQEFKLSMQMFSDVLDKVTKRFPAQSVRIHVETRPRMRKPPKMLIFAEPMDNQLMDTTQAAELFMGMQELREELSGKDKVDQDIQIASHEDVASDANVQPGLTVAELRPPTLTEELDEEEIDTILDSSSRGLEESEKLDDTRARDTGNYMSSADSNIEDQSSSEQIASNTINEDIGSSQVDHGIERIDEERLPQHQHVTSDTMDDSKITKSNPIEEVVKQDVQDQVGFIPKVTAYEMADSANKNNLFNGERKSVSPNQDTNVAGYDMATRYPKAACIFFPDDLAVNAIYPLAASFELYTGIAEHLGLSVYEVPLARLRNELLLQATESMDSLDGFAAKLQICIEEFWQHADVVEGIYVMRHAQETKMFHKYGVRWPLRSLVDDAINIALEHRVDSPPTRAQVEKIKKAELFAPSNLKWMYFDMLRIDRIISPASEDHAIGRGRPLANARFYIKLALLEQLGAVGLSYKAPLQNPALNDDDHGDTPFLAFTFEASNLINGKPVTEVTDVNYLGPWPLLQEQVDKRKSVVIPAVNKSWNVEYKMTMLPDETGRRLYRECKERRRRKYALLDDPKDEHHRHFLKLMTKWSERGRKDKKAADKKFRTGSTKQLKRRLDAS